VPNSAERIEARSNREGLSASPRRHGRLERHTFELLGKSGVLHFNPPLMDLETVRVIASIKKHSDSRSKHHISGLIPWLPILIGVAHVVIWLARKLFVRQM
jgi:hypothetical protein